VLYETRTNLLPEIDLDASKVKARSSDLTSVHLPPGTPLVTTTSRLALSTAFELDLWGKLRRATESARAQMLGTRYAKDVTALTLAGTTTRAYFTLRALDAQIALTRETLTAREESLTLAQNRASGGLASDLDVYQAQGARADAALQLLDLQRQRALVEHQLGSLTGTLDLKVPAVDVMTPQLPALPPAGLPATLLERRPDVRQAEQALVAANAQIGVAKAEQLPTFSLLGAYGGQSAASHDLYQEAARVWSVGPSVHWPIFDAGKYRARTRQAQARQKISAAAYQKAVETAFREVADALTNLAQTRAAVDDTQAKVDAARKALGLSRLRYESGYSGYLEVLDAQRTANTAELALVQNRQALLSYSIDLMKALGGGWSPADAEAKR
jgi:multidrug efflux system outer membrane protein